MEAISLTPSPSETTESCCETALYITHARAPRAQYTAPSSMAACPCSQLTPAEIQTGPLQSEWQERVAQVLERFAAAVESFLKLFSELISQFKGTESQSTSTPTTSTTPSTPTTLSTVPASSLLKNFNQSDFAKKLDQSLTPNKAGEVHEEQLYRATASYLLQQKGASVVESFEKSVTDSLAAMKQAKKHACEEKAVAAALRNLVSTSALSQAEAERANGIAFRAAQLDQISDALYDGRGSASDRTIATAPKKTAIDKAGEALRSMSSGATTITARSLTNPVE